LTATQIQRQSSTGLKKKKLHSGFVIGSSYHHHKIKWLSLPLKRPKNTCPFWFWCHTSSAHQTRLKFDFSGFGFLFLSEAQKPHCVASEVGNA